MKNRVKEIRKKVGLSQHQLAYLTGLSQSTISHIERGAFIPTIDSAYKIAAVLDYDVKEVFVPEACELPKPFYVQEDYGNGRTGNNHPTDQRAVNAYGGEEAVKTAGSDSRIHRRLKK